jgi:hypothetical protein
MSQSAKTKDSSQKKATAAKKHIQVDTNAHSIQAKKYLDAARRALNDNRKRPNEKDI